MDSVHGLSYPDGLLDVLPVLDTPKDGEEPIRALSAAQFADIHLQHTLAHPPDNALFPFLHGLEGDNHAQNTFFASSSSAVAQRHGQSFHHHHHVHAHAHKITPRIPKYRGLVWVVCEDDLQKVGDGVTLRVLGRKPIHNGIDGFRLTPPSTSSLSSEESDTSSFEDDFEDEDEEDEEMLMITDDVVSLKSHAAAGGSSFGIISDLQVRAEVDPSSDAEGIHSILGPSPTQMDIGFHVRVHVSGGDANPVSSPSRAFSERDTSAYDERMSGQATLHFEGSHMHPVSHRAPVPSGENAHLNHMHPHGLGISIPTSSNNTSTSSSASTSTSTPSSAGSTPNSSIFSSDSPCSESSLSSPITVSSLDGPTPVRASSEENCPSTPSANPRPLDLERSPPLSARSLSSIRSLRKRRICLDPRRPPLLTSTFRPKELLKRARVAGIHKYQIPAREEIDRVRQGLRFHPFRPPVRVPVNAQSEKDEEREKGKDREKEKEEDIWEFVPARVPDGISLRNFGIQVPIYATLSDIVVYSPYGVTSAVLALARRFRAAIKAKRRERMKRAGIDVDLLDEPDDDSHCRDAQEVANEMITHDEAYTGIEPTYAPSQHSTEQDITHPRPFLLHSSTHTEITIPAASKADLKAKAREAAAEFVRYRVFVLDASEEEMREEMPHLMMRMYCEGEGAGVGGRSSHAPVEADLAWKENNGTAKRSYDASSAGTEPGHGFAAADSGAHTDRSDGHIVELGVIEEEDRRRRLKVEESRVGMDVDVTDVMGAGMDLDLPPQTHGQTKEEEEDLDEVLHSIPNTVEFTLREKEEMRNLTKASEIISLYPESVYSASSSTTVTSSTHLVGQSHLDSHPFFTSPLAKKGPAVENDHATISTINARFDSRVGQVYLGNSGDVPLAPDLPSQFRHAASVPRDVEEEVSAKCSLKTLTRHLRGVEGLEKEYGVDDEEEEEDVDSEEILPHVDPFNYTGTNDPAKGFGFDICIECHDLAPFPNAAHLRAAEEHLGMLDALWREKWEAAWYAKEEHRMREAQSEFTVNDATSNSPRMVLPPPAPPRPPPHANAVIHLPFPSSPPNTQTTMVALLPVIRFLEKWIRPVPPASTATTPNTPPDLNNLITVRTVGAKKNMTGAPVSSSGPPTKSPANSGNSGTRRWSSVSSLLPLFPSFSGVGGGGSNKDQQPQQQPQSQQTSSIVGGANLNATHPPSTLSPNAPPPSHPSPRTRSLTSPAVQYPHAHMHRPPVPVQARTRPLKVLMYSSDGYTESSVPALCLLMVIKGLGLPEAYLELQIGKKRSFFVYQTDLGILKRVEGRLREEREREKEREKERERERMAVSGAYSNALSSGNINANGKRTAMSPPSSGFASATRAASGVYWSGSSNSNATSGATKLPSGNSGSYMGRPAAKSISFARPPPASSPPLPPPAGASHSSDIFRGSESLPSQTSMPPHSPNFSTSDHFAPDFTPQQVSGNNTAPLFKGRPRAITSPLLPSLFGGDHQSWFNDPRFDGSFPSQVLPFLYLGNLNHASNVYMLHALGITHVVSVGECALVPPPHHMVPHAGGMGVYTAPSSGTHHISGRGFSSHGSLWIEEREGRIKVMDIKGVCDDGIDTLEPQLEPICDWIDKARQEGGQVLVHCRVGVSRSATVTIAYVMKHLNVPLVDAYLIVRSRRLSVLIQPNMRLLYNLCGWEIKLAKERAKDNKRRLLKELSRTLTWPYLAKEVHALNEKYLH